MFKKYRLKDYDFYLIILVLCLTTIGVLAVGSANEAYRQKQLYGMIGGFLIMIILSFFDYTFWLKFYWLIYGVTITMLALVAYSSLGDDGGGAVRWLEIGIRFQPSELAKILLILFFAQFIMKYKDKLSTVKILAMTLALFAIPAYLIFDQPDLSTTIVVTIMFCVLLFVGGLSYRIVAGVIAVAIPLGIILFILILQPDQNILQWDYQQFRILAWLYPDEYKDTYAYQQQNSIMAIGSGQLYGKGLNNNEITSVKNGDFISAPHTDFIFTVIGEELGFLGTAAVIILIFLIIIELLSIARKSKELSGTLIAAGLVAIIGFQSFVNIAVTTGVLPNTGITLPFVSYGLSSLMSMYIGIGFVLNVRLQCIRKYNN